jgi:hypothetical protein
VFDTFGTERLTKWKEFRENLETSQTPLEDVASLWSRAPFVNPYIDPTNPPSWPDPWHLVLDNRYDDLAIVLGMLYTLKLSKRFMDTHFEIHMSMQRQTNQYCLIVDKTHVLNFNYGLVDDINKIDCQTSMIWSGTNLP